MRSAKSPFSERRAPISCASSMTVASSASVGSRVESPMPSWPSDVGRPSIERGTQWSATKRIGYAATSTSERSHAYTRQAEMSSAVRSGNSPMISSGKDPDAKYPRMRLRSFHSPVSALTTTEVDTVQQTSIDGDTGPLSPLARVLPTHASTSPDFSRLGGMLSPLGSPPSIHPASGFPASPPYGGSSVGGKE